MLDNIIDLIKRLVHFLLELLSKAWDAFLAVNIFEKVIVINTITALLAIMLPVAKHYLFDTYFSVNNPLAVYLIGIVILMYVTSYYAGKVSYIARMVINTYYLFWVLYIHLGQGIIKTAYSITAGYYINIAVPIIYLVFASLSYFIYRKY